MQKPIKVRDVKLVSEINDGVILGMPFLARHDCRINFTRPIVTIGPREVICADLFGRLMASCVQMFQKVTILNGQMLPSPAVSHHITMPQKKSG